MRYSIEVDDRFVIPKDRFNNTSWITQRLESCPPAQRTTLGAILRYLYLDDGPKNLPRGAFRQGEHLLEDAEKVVTRWKITRTNGSERKRYGPEAGVAARVARYRCSKCGMPDVRVLDLDHIEGRRSSAKTFDCLCVMCHRLKSRTRDWSVPPSAG